MTFVDVILPLALNRLYTYSIPDELQSSAMPGKRVLVQFGKQKIYSAVIRKVHQNIPSYETKEIIEVLDDDPLINAKQFQLWDWISEYYMCSVGEVMSAALPSALKLESESTVALNPGFDGDHSKLTDREYLVYEALQTEPQLPVKEIQNITGLKNVFRLLKSMAEKGVILLNEEVKKKVKTRFTVFVMLSEKCNDADFMKSIFEELEKKAPKQLELLMHLLNLTVGERDKFIPKNKLLKMANATSAMLNALIKKQVLQIFEKAEYEILATQADLKTSALSDIQQIAFDTLKQQFENHPVVLLHGVTSSGKTEIFIHKINEVIQQGKQILYLLPEIALTTQMIVRLKKYFGDNLLVYHSRYNEKERLNTWNRMLHFNDELRQNPTAYQIIIGARSAVFLPYSQLGLVIVDEEHEPSYKQFDPSPRYHARDTAIILAQLFKAKTILGSATPSVESYFNAVSQKFGLVKLDQRYAGMEMPEIEIVDLKEAYRKKKMKASFSTDMLENVRSALQNNEQIILFQNRRGFATILQCRQCAWIPNCINCDVSLTYHKNHNLLLCHYCGFRTSVPSKCKACSSPDVRMHGIGTERIEEDLQVFFPDKIIARLDIDAARTRLQYQQILNDFENGNIDILVGTQMVTKGLDFDNVSTVGIISADSLMSYPDFRSGERGFQLMSQVSGRSGRKNKRGKVIIQTYNPANKIINFVQNHAYILFYNAELEERKRFNYPPFSRIIELTVKHKDAKTIEDAAQWLGNDLRMKFQKRVLGPVTPVISRINNYYLRQLVIKFEREASAREIKKRIQASIDGLLMGTEFKNCWVQLDVDPY